MQADSAASRRGWGRRQATMRVLGILMAVSGASGVPPPDLRCDGPDVELIYCPLPEAPRVTELRDGKVTVALQIDPDGHVRSSRVVSSSGHAAWASAAQAAVAKWRYSPA